MKKITNEFLAKLEAWMHAGDRHIKIEKKSNGKGWEVWIYDYSVAGGVFLTEENMDQDYDLLIKAETRRQLLIEINQLKGKTRGELLAELDNLGGAV